MMYGFSGAQEKSEKEIRTAIANNYDYFDRSITTLYKWMDEMQLQVNFLEEQKEEEAKQPASIDAPEAIPIDVEQ